MTVNITNKISNASKVRKPSCEHVDGQCDLCDETEVPL